MIHQFVSSYISQGNHVFPKTLTIDDTRMIVSYYKPKLIGSRTISFNARDISSVTMNTRTEYLYLCEIVLLVRGGDVLSLNGLSPSEARRIKELIDGMKSY